MKTSVARFSLALTARRSIIGFGIIVAGIALLAIGSAFVSQTPEPETGAEGFWEGFGEWSRNVGIEFVKSLGTGLNYSGYVVIPLGIVLLIYWHFRD